MKQPVEVLIIKNGSDEAEKYFRSLEDIFEVMRVDKIDDALKHLEANPVDVIVLDGMLEEVKTIRKHVSDPAIIVMSADKNPDVAMRCYQEGAQEFLVKQDIGNGTLARVVAASAVRRFSHKSRVRQKVGLDTTTVSRSTLDQLRLLGKKIDGAHLDGGY